jgi:hypothetical protein
VPDDGRRWIRALPEIAKSNAIARHSLHTRLTPDCEGVSIAPGSAPYCRALEQHRPRSKRFRQRLVRGATACRRGEWRIGHQPIPNRLAMLANPAEGRCGCSNPILLSGRRLCYPAPPNRQFTPARKILPLNSVEGLSVVNVKGGPANAIPKIGLAAQCSVSSS